MITFYKYCLDNGLMTFEDIPEAWQPKLREEGYGPTE